MSAPPEVRRGRFITLEGGEGAGKSTQANALVAALSGFPVSAIAAARPGSSFSGRETGGMVGKVLLTREPGGTRGAEEIRDLLVSGDSNRWDVVTEALLLYAARRDHWYRLIVPALRRGTWVVSDRFADSTTVYQGFAGGVSLDELATLHRLALKGEQPDLTFFLDIPVDLGLERSLDRNREKAVMVEDIPLAHRPAAEDRFEKISPEYHQQVREGFVDLAERNPDRIVTIDANRSPEEVGRDMLAVVKERFAEDLAGG